MTDQFIAENVFKSTNHKNVVVVPGLTEMIEEVLGLIEVQGIPDVEKCSKQLAVTVEKNVKYHSSQKKTDQFIVKNVFKVIEKLQNKINFSRAKLFSLIFNSLDFF
jgi:hypothetical protein